MITVRVIGQQATIISKDDLVSGAVNFIPVSVSFDSSWNGLTRYCQFTKDDKSVDVMITTSTPLYFPHEVLTGDNGYVYLKFWGATLDEDGIVTVKKATANPLGCYMVASKIVFPADVLNPPTPDVYSQVVFIMDKQKVDALAAQAAQRAAEIASSNAEQDRNDVAAIKEEIIDYASEVEANAQAVSEDRSAVNTALLGFAETTLPDAIQAVEDKADIEIAHVGQAGDTQVQAVNAAGAEQIGLATEQADRAEGEADKSTSQASKSESYAVGGTGTRPGEDTDNSKHYSGISLQAMTDFLAMLGKDIATLTDGKLTPSQIPALSINDVFPVASEAELLTLTAERGDCGIIVVDNVVTDSYILAADDPAQLENWKKLGVSYVANAGHASTADNAVNADKINNKRIVGMTQSQYDIAALDDDTFYIVTPDGV